MKSTDPTRPLINRSKTIGTEGRYLNITRRLLEDADADRRHFSRFMADDVAQCLAALKLDLEAARSQPEMPGDMQLVLDKSLEKVYRLLDLVCVAERETYPRLVDDMGLPWAVQSLCSFYGDRLGVEVACPDLEILDLKCKASRLSAYLFVKNALISLNDHLPPGSIESARLETQATCTTLTLNLLVHLAETASRPVVLPLMGALSRDLQDTALRLDALNGSLKLVQTTVRDITAGIHLPVEE